MNEQSAFKKSLSIKTIFNSFYIGLIIPLASYLIEILRQDLPFHPESISTIHRNNPLLWFIDFVPIIIVLLSAVTSFGKRYFEQTKDLERIVEERSQEILKQKGFFESVVNNSPIAIVTMDPDQHIISVNSAFTDLFQYTKEEVLGKSVDDIIASGHHLDQAKGFSNNVLNGKKIHGVGKRKRKDGENIDVEIYGVPILVDGRRIGILGLYKDISIQKQAEDSIKKSEMRFRGLFHDSPISMWEVDFSKLKTWLENLEFNNEKDLQLFLLKKSTLYSDFAELIEIIDTNQSTLRLFKANDLKHLKENFNQIFNDQSNDGIQVIVGSFFRGAKQIETEMTHQTLTGEFIHTIVRLSIVTGAEDDWSRVYVSILDISERKWAEERLRYLSMHDSMTGLYNRAFFEAELRRLSKSRHFPISIIISDLDKLKAVNDTFGHKAGDALICKAASLLTNSFRGEDIIARLGGDEFAVIIPDLDEDTVKSITSRLRKKIDEYNAGFPEDDIEHRVNLSIGSATTIIGRELEELFKIADTRMYFEKQQKRLNFIK